MSFCFNRTKTTCEFSWKPFCRAKQTYKCYRCTENDEKVRNLFLFCGRISHEMAVTRHAPLSEHHLRVDSSTKQSFLTFSCVFFILPVVFVCLLCLTKGFPPNVPRRFVLSVSTFCVFWVIFGCVFQFVCLLLLLLFRSSRGRDFFFPSEGTLR